MEQLSFANGFFIAYDRHRRCPLLSVAGEKGEKLDWTDRVSGCRRAYPAVPLSQYLCSGTFKSTLSPSNGTLRLTTSI
uniref:Sema domain-containing protein n=1 Tax=Ascaris lumbricoides TaxID=6252 RepID=A0A0M3HRC2_ASCLU